LIRYVTFFSFDEGSNAPGQWGLGTTLCKPTHTIQLAGPGDGKIGRMYMSEAIPERTFSDIPDIAFFLKHKISPVTLTYSTDMVRALGSHPKTGQVNGIPKRVNHVINDGSTVLDGVAKNWLAFEGCKDSRLYWINAFYPRHW
jgi:hypothetical protein